MRRLRRAFELGFQSIFDKFLQPKVIRATLGLWQVVSDGSHRNLSFSIITVTLLHKWMAWCIRLSRLPEHVHVFFYKLCELQVIDLQALLFVVFYLFQIFNPFAREIALLLAILALLKGNSLEQSFLWFLLREILHLNTIELGWLISFISVYNNLILRFGHFIGTIFDLEFLFVVWDSDWLKRDGSLLQSIATLFIDL